MLTSTNGRRMNHQRLTDTRDGWNLRFRQAEQRHTGNRGELRITQHDESTGLTVESLFAAYDGISVVTWSATIRSDRRLPVESMSSLNVAVPLSAAGASVDDAEVFWADSTWAAENNWHRAPLRAMGVVDINTVVNPRVPGARFALRSRSAWSTGEHLPDGILQLNGEHPTALMWQIEHNGAWSWEIGEGVTGLQVMAGGPNCDDHQWSIVLEPGVDFTTVPASVAVCSGDWRGAVAEMTLHRRALRDERLGHNGQDRSSNTLVIYNDYMNTLFGDPTAEKEIPLIDAVGTLGVDVFCIDAGWYDSTDGDWWTSVGEWEPSTNRFGDEGLAALAERIRANGMELGLWLEPEVVGIHSPVAAALPEAAFFRRHGERVADDGRYHLDFRCPEVREHLDSTVDRLMRDLRPTFFKFDYNTVPGVGTEQDAATLGEGLLGHCRAYVDWLDSLKRRYPKLVIENCGSGAMRADYAMLQRLDLQSTSDQCDPLIYAAIAAGAPMGILPEQQGNWGYAQQHMGDEEAVLTLAAGVTGRLYLSGFVDRMDDRRLALVRSAIALHREVLETQDSSVPFWPLGLPDFTGEWLATGLLPAPGSEGRTGYMTVWRRAGEQTVTVEVPAGAEIIQVFPNPKDPCASDAKPWRVQRVDESHASLTTTSDSPSARVFALRLP
ncbi:glycoside hydrolase family 36 protein [Bifidobacterium lemurum]|uniref:glycoside hydrolase family 36 protein n=1 Tax=Bifidobacterium lemurum TaxID=1603886 RepID=UPI000934A1C1|nr:glycoside hydrolase family 36 protein [Bifidobacterium lemurum]